MKIRKSKKQQTFPTLGKFIEFIANNKLVVEKELVEMITDGFGTKLTFTDKSYAVISYRTGSIGESGTWWDAIFEIIYVSDK